jgi:K+ transporter
MPKKIITRKPRIYKKKSANGPLIKEQTYREFVAWFSLPAHERGEVKSQGDFAIKYKVNQATLSEWKKRKDFKEQIDNVTLDWGFAKTPNVFAALYKRCVTYGMAQDVELWLAYFKGWDKKQVMEHRNLIGFSKDDLFTMIDLLPADKQKQFHDIIDKLIIETDRAVTQGTLSGSANG